MGTINSLLSALDPKQASFFKLRYNRVDDFNAI